MKTKELFHILEMARNFHWYQ